MTRLKYWCGINTVIAFMSDAIKEFYENSKITPQTMCYFKILKGDLDNDDPDDDFIMESGDLVVGYEDGLYIELFIPKKIEKY